MLHIHIGRITGQGIRLDKKVDADGLPLLHAVSREGTVTFTRPIHVRIHVTVAGETVLIAGNASTSACLACSRCLKTFDLNIEADFSATATPAIPSLIDTDTTEEVELTEDEMDVITYSGDSIDLGDEIAQQIIMALPFKPLCRDSCKGLCNHCGTDLNKTSCQCASQDKNNPFAALKNLSFPNNQE